MCALYKKSLLPLPPSLTLPLACLTRHGVEMNIRLEIRSSSASEAALGFSGPVAPDVLRTLASFEIKDTLSLSS